jgi:hypothetical protein
MASALWVSICGEFLQCKVLADGVRECARERESEWDRREDARVIHGTKIGSEWRWYRGVPAADSCMMATSLAREEEGKWRGDVGVEEGADAGVVGGFGHAGESGETARHAVPISRGRRRRLEKKGADRWALSVRKRGKGEAAGSPGLVC